MARAFLNLQNLTSGCRREDGREFHKSEQVKRGEIVPERWQTLGKEREIKDWPRVIDRVRAFDWPRTENSFVRRVLFAGIDRLVWRTLRKIGGKTHTFSFDWCPAGEPVVVGVQSLAQNPLPYKVNCVFEVIVFSRRKSVLLDVEVFRIRWLLFCFASVLQNKKEQKRSKYRLLWQLNFYPGQHEPVDCDWPPVKSLSFTKTARQKVPFLRTMRWNPVSFGQPRWKTCLAFN